MSEKIVMAEQAQRNFDDANKKKKNLIKDEQKKKAFAQVTKIIRRVKAKINLVFEENTKPAVKRSCKPKIGDH